MAQLPIHVRSRLRLTDIGGWLFRCNPANLDWESGGAAQVESRCAVLSYRLSLIRPGHPVVLWLTGSARAVPPPGVWGVGYATGDVVDFVDEATGTRRAQVMLCRMSPLPAPLHRDEVRDASGTASMEVLRQPFGPNPSYLSPGEQSALERLMGGWPG